MSVYRTLLGVLCLHPFSHRNGGAGGSGEGGEVEPWQGLSKIVISIQAVQVLSVFHPTNKENEITWGIDIGPYIRPCATSVQYSICVTGCFVHILSFLSISDVYAGQDGGSDLIW